ncbi:MAG: ribosomal protein modification protein [Alphaproteobacteria bacterium]|nr:ribosomal protein modification protein [Alphaproteobacteria bacterium]
MIKKKRTVIGWAEWVTLPQLNLPLIKAKIDTGARTSALHAFSIETFKKRGAPWVRFQIHPLQGNRKISVTCEAPVVDRRMVTDSGGKSERRLVIETLAQIGDVTRRIEITLTNREKMAFRMLLGRQAISKFDFLVNPAYTRMLKKVKPAIALETYRTPVQAAPPVTTEIPVPVDSAPLLSLQEEHP